MLDFSHTMGEEILTVNNPSKPSYRKGFRDFEMIEFHGFRFLYKIRVLYKAWLIITVFCQSLKVTEPDLIQNIFKKC